MFVLYPTPSVKFAIISNRFLNQSRMRFGATGTRANKLFLHEIVLTHDPKWFI